MKKLFLGLCTLALATFFVATSHAQIKTPAPSPSATITQQIGLTEVTVEFSRPSVKDRSIFADNGLVPYGQVWRTGANAATKITFGDDVTVGGQALKKGSYAILTVPSADSWKVDFFPYESGSWASYRDKEAVASATADVTTLPFSVESFFIHFADLKDDAANLEFIWADKMASVPLKFAVEEKVMAAIEKTLAGPTAGDYYAAGNYLLSIDKDLDKALMYVQKATKSDNPRFWQVRREALILAKLGRAKEAITAAKQSMELAKKAGNEDYVRLNEASIAEWSKL